MSNIYYEIARPVINHCDYNYGDYGQFWDTETQQPITDQCITHNDDEYETYMDNYEITLTNQEHMLEYEYEYDKPHNPSLFSTIGFVIFIVKAVTGFITK